MNILPKKRWHVRNRDNKERVRVDEENARLQQVKEEERIALADQEVRISILRKNNGKLHGKEVAKVEPTKHINLFEVEENNGNTSCKGNEEYLKEKKAEKETYEQKIGLLKYIGQSSVEAKKKGEIPWYLGTQNKKGDNSVETEGKKKSKLDPMIIVNKNMEEWKKKEKHRKEHKGEHKGDKRKSPILSSSSKTIKQLRGERLKREKKEREKADRLATGHKSDDKLTVEGDLYRYNNQFNPHLARRKFNRYQPY